MKATNLTLAASTCFYAAVARAADPQIQIQQTAFAYSTGSTVTKAAGSATSTSKDYSFDSMPADLEIAVRAGDWELSVFPTQPGASLEVKNEIMPHLEVGFNIGYNRSGHDADDGKKTTETLELGQMVEYEVSHGEQGIEIEARLDLTRDSSKESPRGASATPEQTVETNSRGFVSELTAMYVRRVTDNLEVAGGLGYTFSKAHESTADADITAGAFTVTLLQLRAGIY